MNATTAALIAKMQSMPKAFEVVTLFADGTSRTYQTATRGQADNYAVGEKRKIGRTLLNRDTGATVEVVDVYVAAL